MRELPENTLFDVIIKTKSVNVEATGLSQKEARDLFDKTIKDNPYDTWLQEKHHTVSKNFGFSSVSQGGKNIHVSCKAPFTKGTEKTTCPRRINEMGPWEYKENLDTWNTRGNDRVCSFCGSMHPEDLLNLVKEKGPQVLQETDKRYKLYVRRPEVPNAGFGALKFYIQHLHGYDKIREELYKLTS